jgi:hypothetical protein
MPTIDLKQRYLSCYRASASRPALVEVPDLNALVIEGKGDHTSTMFQDATKVLNTLAQTLNFLLSETDSTLNYTVMPLEVVWKADEESQRLYWTMEIVIPDEVTPEIFQQAVLDVGQRDNSPALAHVRLARLAGGTGVQMLHNGPYDQMEETLAHMRAFANAQGLALYPNTHDIYLNDYNRTRPENLLTIMRAAVQPKK